MHSSPAPLPLPFQPTPHLFFTVGEPLYSPPARLPAFVWGISSLLWNITTKPLGNCSPVRAFFHLAGIYAILAKIIPPNMRRNTTANDVLGKGFSVRALSRGDNSKASVAFLATYVYASLLGALITLLLDL